MSESEKRALATDIARKMVVAATIDGVNQKDFLTKEIDRQLPRIADGTLVARIIVETARPYVAERIRRAVGNTEKQGSPRAGDFKAELKRAHLKANGSILQKVWSSAAGSISSVLNRAGTSASPPGAAPRPPFSPAATSRHR
ncbi:hypothetical protein [Actinoplanes sp. NPDC051494]|uniref:hypothetical protein n=1 Tax=Actinoplanes sp. NPDC051494 TaxID=3363907 RepID=UPI00378FD2AB